jgi:hypothetical protein
MLSELLPEPGRNSGWVKQDLDSRLVHRLEKLQFQLSRNVYAPSFMLWEMLASKDGP